MKLHTADPWITACRSYKEWQREIPFQKWTQPSVAFAWWKGKYNVCLDKRQLDKWKRLAVPLRTRPGVTYFRFHHPHNADALISSLPHLSCFLWHCAWDFHRWCTEGHIIPRFVVVRLLVRAGDDLEGGGSEIWGSLTLSLVKPHADPLQK